MRSGKRSWWSWLGLWLVVLALGVGVAHTVWAQCPSLTGYEDFGRYNKSPNDVAVVEHYVYTADIYGMTVYDINNPAEPVRVGELFLPDEAQGIEVSGSIAYIADGDHGLQVVDVSNPAHPTVLGSVDTPGYARSVAVSGSTAYVADDWQGLQVIDVSIPAHPTIFGNADTQGSDRDVVISGSTAYVADGFGLEVIDLSAPARPTILGYVDTPGYAYGVAVSGNIAYIADGMSGLQVINVSIPARPTILGGVFTPGYAYGVTVSGNTAYVADGGSGLQVIDVSNPASPMILGSVGMPGYVYGVAISGSSAYLADRGAGLQVVDVSDSASPTILGSVSTPGYAHGVAVSGGTAYVADGWGGLQVVDVSNPAHPTVLGSVAMPGIALRVAVSGSTAYVADNWGGLQVVDVSDPARPTILGSVSMQGVALNVAVSGSTVYVAAADHGLQIVDVSHPAHPTILGRVDMGGWSLGVAVSGGIAYVADGDDGLQIIDVSDPSNPTILGDLLMSGYASGVAISGDTAYVADGDYGLRIVDVTRPTNPKPLRTVATPGYAYGVAVSHSTAYIANAGSLQVIDVSDPSDPSLIASVAARRSSSDIALDASTGTAWLADGALIEGVDVACPSCAGLQVMADPSRILTGGKTSTITVTVTDPFGNPAAGQIVTGSTDLGTLSAFMDNGDGTYTSTLTSGDSPGVATIKVSLNQIHCFRVSRVTIQCAYGKVNPPTNVRAVAQGDNSVQVSWNASPGGQGYRVYRFGVLVADLGPGATSFTDTIVNPGTQYCYKVASQDSCHSWWLSAQSCATTSGSPWMCPALAARDPMGYTNQGNIRDVVVRGNYAFYADAYGLGVADLSDPSHPVELAHWYAPEEARGVALGPGGLVLLADGSSGLFIIDATDPSQPHELGSYGQPVYAEGVAVSGNTAYVADGGFRVEIIDITHPTNPTQLASYNTSGYAYGVAVAGSTAYVAVEGSGLEIIDVSQPTHPTQLGSYNIVGESHGVAVSGHTAYLVGHSGLRVIDVSNPMKPTLLGQVATPGDARGVVVSGSTAYVADGDAGLEIIDVSQPAHPTQLGIHDTLGTAYGLAVSGDTAYIADGDHGLQLIDVSNPTHLTLLGSLDTRGYARGVAVSGHMAYVANGPSGLQVIDVSNPMKPTLLGQVATPGDARGVVVLGSTAYVADGGSGLQVIDVSTPAHPTLLGSVDTPGFARGVAVSGNTAYVADGGSGLQVIDVSTPAHPTLLGSVDTPGIAHTVAVSGSIAYVADEHGLEIIDVSDPTRPTVLENHEMPDSVEGVAVFGGAAYVTDGYDGLQIIDVSDPTHPTTLGSYNMAQGANSVTLAGSTAYVADGHHIDVIDVADPTSPALRGSVNTLGTVYGIAVSGSTAYVAAGSFFDIVTTECHVPEADFAWKSWNLDVEFTDQTLYGPTSWSWDFGDGSTSNQQNPSHRYVSSGTYTVTLTVESDEGSDSISHQVEVTGGSASPTIDHPGDYIYLIPASAHSSGVGGTNWVSDLVIYNAGSSTAKVNLYFLKTGQDNSGVTGQQITVEAGASVRLGDVVESTFAEGSTSGALYVGSDQPLLITSRTYNKAPSGTYGQFIAGLPVSKAIGANETARLIQLTRTNHYRTNIGFANATDKTISVKVDLYRSSGAYIATRSYSVSPYGFFQKTDIIGTDVSDAYALVSSSTSGAKFFTYASVVDNRTGDPVFITPGAGTASAGQRLYIPAAAHVTGVGGTAWRTDVEIYNAGATTATYRIELLQQGRTNTSPASKTYQLAQHRSVRYADALHSLFGFSGSGALRITAVSGTIMVTSRTYNQTAHGTYGQFIPAVPASSAITAGDRAPVIGLSQSGSETTGYRTNIGFVNTSGKTITVSADLYTGTGTKLGTKTVTLSPYEFTQVGKIFHSVTSQTLDNCYAILSTSTSGGSFLAYGSVVDNHSGDPVYVPASSSGGGGGGGGSQTITVTLPGEVKMELGHIPAGAFMIGSPTDGRRLDGNDAGRAVRSLSWVWMR